MNKEQRDKRDAISELLYGDPVGSMRHQAFNEGFEQGHASRQSEIDELVRALEFYADTNNWDYEKTGDLGKSRATGNTCYDIMLFDFDRSHTNRSDYAGKTARQALTKHKGGV